MESLIGKLDSNPLISFDYEYHSEFTRNCIYMGIDSLGGSIYIGQTIQPIKERIKQHRKFAKTHHSKLCKVIQKYGWKNMHWKVIHALPNQGIATPDDVAQLAELEAHYIRLYNTYGTTHGLNGTIGGERPNIDHMQVVKERKERWTARITAERSIRQAA